MARALQEVPVKEAAVRQSEKAMAAKAVIWVAVQDWDCSWRRRCRWRRYSPEVFFASCSHRLHPHACKQDSHTLRRGRSAPRATGFGGNRSRNAASAYLHTNLSRVLRRSGHARRPCRRVRKLIIDHTTLLTGSSYAREIWLSAKRRASSTASFAPMSTRVNTFWLTYQG